MLKRFLIGGSRIVLLCSVALMYVSCGSKEDFTQQATTQFFTQDYNPPYLDVLWMINNQSPMHRIESHLVSETQNFFSRLDSMSTYYQMAYVSADMQFARGALQPQGEPVVLTQNTGTEDQRVGLFGDIISQIINLQTGYLDEGFESVRTALLTNFVPRKNVPLVLVFISDADDHSPLTDPSGSAVNFYANAYQAIKGNDPTMLRVYSVNYEPGAPTDQNRCATRYDADIDSSGFQNRYFDLANQLAGSSTNVTADLCGSFSSQIDLTGLKQSQLSSTFLLDSNPNPSSISVTVTQGNQVLSNLAWTYDATNNQIDFSTTPPAGSVIEVTYITE